MPTYAQVNTKIDAIENEMRRINLWQTDPLDPDQYEFEMAFAMDTMAFSQWLQFIFIPRVRQTIAEQGKFPSESLVSVQAVREFDTLDIDTERLQTLLHEFDNLF